ERRKGEKDRGEMQEGTQHEKLKDTRGEARTHTPREVKTPRVFRDVTAPYTRHTKICEESSNTKHYTTHYTTTHNITYYRSRVVTLPPPLSPVLWLAGGINRAHSFIHSNPSKYC
ncbi:hypothetical protein E4T56_gene17007, partial [Termitomyces sp. T112]